MIISLKSFAMIKGTENKGPSPEIVHNLQETLSVLVAGFLSENSEEFFRQNRKKLIELLEKSENDLTFALLSYEQYLEEIRK